ncbi:MAG: hypothetical protein GC180_03920 [Bacteroidetes bacterium]|nr:hypothetical protein [Bacteroidota bacterium]
MRETVLRQRTMNTVGSQYIVNLSWLAFGIWCLQSGSLASASYFCPMQAIRTVAINGLLLNARIGLYDYERINAGLFCVDAELSMVTEIKQEAVALEESMDYEVLLKIIQEEMSKAELLMESTANRIVLRVRDAFSSAISMMVHIQKKNPPLDAEMDSSSVKLEVRFSIT